MTEASELDIEGFFGSREGKKSKEVNKNDKKEMFRRTENSIKGLECKMCGRIRWDMG